VEVGPVSEHGAAAPRAWAAGAGQVAINPGRVELGSVTTGGLCWICWAMNWATCTKPGWVRFERE
jgi:hypothetical protein